MEQEPLNEYDPFAVSVLRGRHIIGHVPIELSRIIFFALEHGCEFEAVVQDTRAFQSPLVQGGLEIKVLVYCKWTEHGLASLQTMITEKYCFETRMVDDFDSLLREIQESLPANDSDSDNELISQFENVEVIDDDDDDE